MLNKLKLFYYNLRYCRHPLIVNGHCKIDFYPGSSNKVFQVVKGFIAFKKTTCKGTNEPVLTELSINEATFIAFTTEHDGKFRANRVEVCNQFMIDWEEFGGVFFYHTDKRTDKRTDETTPWLWGQTPIVYKTGQMVYPDRFDISNEVCGNGIHFFLTEKEAVNY